MLMGGCGVSLFVSRRCVSCASQRAKTDRLCMMQIRLFEAVNRHRESVKLAIELIEHLATLDTLPKANTGFLSQAAILFAHHRLQDRIVSFVEARPDISHQLSPSTVSIEVHHLRV